MEESESDHLLMQRHGLRVTRQRMAVLAALRGVTSHPTAEELHTIVQAAEGSMSLATVYNTLQALCDSSLCRKVATIGPSARYDAGLHAHVHMRDDASGRVIDLPADLSERLLACIPTELMEEIAERLGVAPDLTTLQLVGRSSTSRLPHNPSAQPRVKDGSATR